MELTNEQRLRLAESAYDDFITGEDGQALEAALSSRHAFAALPESLKARFDEVSAERATARRVVRLGSPAHQAVMARAAANARRADR